MRVPVRIPTVTAHQNDRPVRAPRPDSREVAELKQLAIDQPELADAVNMQLALVEVQRRLQSRVPLPWIQPDPAWITRQQAAGRPLVRFADIPLEWSDLRLTLRQTADILLRFDALDAEDHALIVALGRDGNTLEPLVAGWYAATSGVDGGTAGDVAAVFAAAGAPASLDQVLILALRPFLAKSTEAISKTVDLTAWDHNRCPACGGEPDFAVITPGADRRLICGRCVGQWGFPAMTCPFCANDNPKRMTSFATRDGRYRVSGCDVCRRYLKAYDARHASRPVMVSVDSIATLPLDAAAMQRGYLG